MRFYRDVYSKKLLQEALDPVDAVEAQKQVAPHDPQYCDLFCQPRVDRLPKSEVLHLGVLWDMTAQICTIEPCSKTPTVTDLRGLARKQLNLHHELCKSASDVALPVPQQWILSPGLPVGAVASVAAASVAGWPPGFYRSVDLLNQWIVVLAELPKTAETRLLRLMGPDEMRQEAIQEISALADEDPTRKPLIVILHEMVYFLVQQVESDAELSATEKSQMTQLRQEFEQFQTNLLQKGAARGKAEMLLAVLAARGVLLTDAVRQKILTCTDLAELDRLAVLATTAVTPADVLTAAA